MMTGCDGITCQNGGTCEPTYADDAHGHHCTCTPGFTGDLCQTFTDLSLTSPFNYDTSGTNDNLELSLRMQTTLSSMSIASNALFQITINAKGNLEFAIYDISLQSEKAVNHGDWVEVVVKYDNSKATLSYNDKNCPDWCESSETVSSESENFAFSQVTIGSDVNQSEVSKFVECVEDFRVNGELLVGGQNGVPVSYAQCERVERCEQMSCNGHGTCLDKWTAFECVCDEMYAGDFCQEGKIKLSQKPSQIVDLSSYHCDCPRFTSHGFLFSAHK